jgi:hypothetical protein
MTVSPLAIEFKFQGVDYVARITPTLDDDLLPVTDVMMTSERVRELSSQIDEMVNRIQGYTPEHGDLVAITDKGVQFANNLPPLPGAAHTAGVWERFVSTLHESDYAKGNITLPAGNARVEIAPDAFTILSPDQKRAVFSTLYVNVYRECKGEEVDYTLVEQHCLNHFLQHHKLKRIPPKESLRIMLLAEQKDKDSSMYLNREEEMEQARRIAAPVVIVS